MTLKTREICASEPPLRQLSWGRALLLKIWGPAESWDNPLTGTRFDPQVRQRRDQVRRAERRARRARRRRAREEHRLARVEELTEHHTPDE